MDFDILYATTFLSYKSKIVDKYNRLFWNIKYVIRYSSYWSTRKDVIKLHLF